MSWYKNKLNLIFSAFIILTVGEVCYWAKKDAIRAFHNDLNHDKYLVSSLLENQISSYLYGLQGARGIILVTNPKDRVARFKNYSTSRDHFKNFPGSHGFGYIKYIPTKNALSYETSYPHDEDQMVVELLEPEEHNEHCLNYNIAQEDDQRKAAWESALSGKPVLAYANAALLNHAADPGFVLYLPVYSTVNTPATPTERIHALQGWIFSPIVLKDALAHTEKFFPRQTQAAFSVNDTPLLLTVGPTVAPDTVINNYSQMSVPIAGKRWTVTISRSTDEIRSKILLIFFSHLGLLIALLIGNFFLFRMLEGHRRLIEERNQWIKSILKNAGHPIIATDLTGIIRTFSPAAEEMLGYKAEEVIGLQSPSIFHDHHEVVDRARALSLEVGQQIEPGLDVFTFKADRGIPDIHEWTFVHKNGARIPVRLCLTAILDANEQIAGYMGIAEDLTSHNAMKDDLEAERMKLIHSSKMSLLGEMAGGIAHEINTPLAVIQGKANLLLKKLKANVSHEDMVPDLIKITETVQRITKIIKSMKVYSRTDDKDDTAVTNVHELIDNMIDLCSDKLKTRQIVLSVDVPNDIHFDVRPNEIIQVLINLVSNAHDAIRDQAEPWMNIKAFREDSSVVIWITDSGNGIDPALQSKIMVPFFTTKPVGVGTGLGLSISSSIVESNNGSLKLDTLCKNTRFVIRLPYASAVAVESKGVA